MTSRGKTETILALPIRGNPAFCRMFQVFLFSLKHDVRSTGRGHFPSPLQREASIENVDGVICGSTPAAIRENIH